MKNVVRICVVAAIMASSSGAMANTVTIGPADCPAPADVASSDVVTEEIVAPDLNHWRDVPQSQRTIVDVTVAEPPAVSRVFQRYDVDPETGAVFSTQEALCGDE